MLLNGFYDEILRLLRFLSDILYCSRFYLIFAIISWSLGLLYATFPKLFTEEMNFDFDNSLSKSVNDYLFPLIMALILFLVDTIYGFLKEMMVNQYSHVVGVFIMLVLFLLAFVLSLKIGDPDLSRICFIASWIFLSVMKYFKTECYGTNEVVRQGKKVSSN